MSVGLPYFLFLSAGLFAVGCFGLLARRHAVAVLMSGQLMFGAAAIALVAFARFGYRDSQPLAGQVFALFVMGTAAVELALGIALLLLVFRQRSTIFVDEFGDR